LTSKTFEHKGIVIELLGLIQLTGETTSTSQFITLSKEICTPGKLTQPLNKFDFIFKNVEKSYETYHGNECSVKYILRCTIKTSLRNLQWEREFGVSNPLKRENVFLKNNENIKMEVGIDEWLHLSVLLDQSKLGIKDCITGKVEFKKVSMKLKNMLLQVIKRETIIGMYEDNSIICKFEIMDGAPVKNETIPIRFFLKPYELTPTYQNVNNKFSVKYFINLVLYDINEKRYYKQHEIELFRILREKKKKIEKIDFDGNNNNKKEENGKKN